MTEVLERPDTTVELDVNLDIEPICEGSRKDKPCEDPATWACRTVCDNCERNKLALYCDWHHNGMHPGGYIKCGDCNARELSILTEVRL